VLLLLLLLLVAAAAAANAMPSRSHASKTTANASKLRYCRCRCRLVAIRGQRRSGYSHPALARPQLADTLFMVTQAVDTFFVAPTPPPNQLVCCVSLALAARLVATFR